MSNRDGKWALFEPGAIVGRFWTNYLSFISQYTWAHIF